uniref:G-protein coupled receptors family 1 profile domain-containing protein n=1 Tax=Esox lucius TaxID=8010 RepID=A0AAY5L753_ESOLU
MESSSIQENITEQIVVYDYYYEYGGEPLDGFGLVTIHKPKEFGRTFLPISYVIICILSIPINIIFIKTLIKSKHQKKTVPINIAISDILFVITLPFWAVHAYKEWIFGNNMCKTITVTYITTLYSSILFITCISVDRYLSVVGNFSNRHFTPINNTLVCIVVWSLSILAAAPHWTFVKEQEIHSKKVCSYDFGQDHMPPWKILIKIQLNIFGFLMPFLIMLFCYLQVQCAIAKFKVGERYKGRKLVMIVVFFMLWFPYNFVTFLHFLQNLHVISSCFTALHLYVAVQVTEVMAYSHAFINPIVYSFVNKSVWRMCFAKLCGERCRRSTEYSLECSDNTDTKSVQIGGIELKAVQR